MGFKLNLLRAFARRHSTRGIEMNKKLALSLLGIAVLCSNTGTAIGGAPGAAKDQFPVSWQLTNAACPNVPAGATIDGAGIEDSITTTTTVGGITTILN